MPSKHHLRKDFRKSAKTKRTRLMRWYLWTKYKFLRLSGTPHTIAVGLAWGGAISFLPFLGIHIACACALTWIMRGNLIAATLGTLLGNPWTFPIFFWLDYKIGRWLLVIFGHNLSPERSMDHYSNIQGLLDDAMDVYGPMWVGGMIMMIVSYPILYQLCLPLARKIIVYRTHRRIEGHKRRRGIVS